MAVYSAFKGSNAIIKLGNSLLCTAKSCEFITERKLHEVYECFLTEPTAIIRGREQYKIILESVVFQEFNVNLLNSDGLSIEIFIGNRMTAFDGCYFNIHSEKLDKNSVIERVEILAKRRTECVMA